MAARITARLSAVTPVKPSCDKVCGVSPDVLGHAWPVGVAAKAINWSTVSANALNSVCVSTLPDCAFPIALLSKLASAAVLQSGALASPKLTVDRIPER